MCGICGIALSSRSGAEVQRSTIERMRDVMVHRGPDGAGTFVSGRIGLGHRRLSIVDPKAGQQPMASDDNAIQIVYNGEVYNHPDIQRRLEAEGHRYHTHCDTESVLKLYDQFGVQTPVHLRGMFAFAIWDRARETLFLARDRFGVKPLYYAVTPDGSLYFGSEIKAILASGAIAAAFDEASLPEFLSSHSTFGIGTMYTGIRRLEAGHTLTWRDGTITIARYWDLSFAHEGEDQRDEAQIVAEFDALFREAVRMRLMADVPLGAFLSGGIDSSLIVALMQAQSARPVRTFTIGFRESAFDEAPHAEAVARHLGTEHTTMFVTAQDALDVIPRLPSIYSEPFADSSQIPTVLVSQLAREHVTVALSGDGGDELFGGYSRYPLAMRAWPRLARIPYSMRRATSAMVTSVSAPAWNRALGPMGLVSRGVTGDRMHKLASLIDMRNFPDFYRHLVSAWQRPQDLLPGVVERDTAIREPFAAGRGGLLADMMFRDQVSYLPDDILTKVDRAAMAASLETRAPLLDHRVAEFAWQLPQNCWQRDGQGKWIVRQVLDRYVPRTLIDRPKQGFGVPIAEWLRGPLRDWADDLLSPEALRRDGIFRAEPVLQTWKEHRNGTRNWAPSLWHLLMFQAWRRG